MTLSVISLNLWRGGDQVSFASVVEAIYKSDAHVAAVQEIEGNTERLAHELGWPYWNARLQLVSRLPLFDPQPLLRAERLVEREGGFALPYAWVQVAPGRLVAIANVHLPSYADGPEALRDKPVTAGDNDAEIRVQEHVMRGLCARQICETMVAVGRAHRLPVLIVGDFNSPSHRDCPDQTCRVAWPATRVMERHGFVDVYRTIHPDPVTHPGLTWTTGYPHPHIDDNEQLNRIDFEWLLQDIDTLPSQRITPTRAFLVGEAGRHMFRGRHINAGVEVSVTPWPSDHRALVCEYNLDDKASTPAISSVHLLPRLVSVIGSRQLTPGDTLRIATFFDPKREADLELALVERSSTTHPRILQSVGLRRGTDRRVIELNLPIEVRNRELAVVICRRDEHARLVPVLPLAYQVVSLAPGPRLPRIDVRVLADGAIQVAWHNAPGNKWDWLGVFEAEETDLESQYAYRYLGGALTGTSRWDLTLLDLPSGTRLQVRLLADDSNRLLAVSDVFALRAS